MEKVEWPIEEVVDRSPVLRENQQKLIGRMDAINVLRNGILGVEMQNNPDYLAGFKTELEGFCLVAEQDKNPVLSGKLDDQNKGRSSSDLEKDIISCSLQLSKTEYNVMAEKLTDSADAGMRLRARKLRARVENVVNRLYRSVDVCQEKKASDGYFDSLAEDQNILVSIVGLMKKLGYLARLKWNKPNEKSAKIENAKASYALDFYYPGLVELSEY